MDLSDPPALIGVRLVVAVDGLALLLFGLRVALTRRLPRRRFGGRGVGSEEQPQPVRIGGGVALVGAALLVQQVAALATMPAAVGLALLGVALVLFVAAVVWFGVRRD
ncbi:hypothetical protein ACFOOK_22295 [Micromonospora krabiensis]|uniref:Uncharacterized protein n=1 Tax=Micromonospora krabiensis TaxID=307121 RepID=A0A1C3N7Z2_9ACTN|nr:hypothetical protein [Micromonospora krabiensis]SBV28698.1 hypothetical protein GA0070620_4252 [Micromonospora krabiensis]